MAHISQKKRDVLISAAGIRRCFRRPFLNDLGEAMTPHQMIPYRRLMKMVFPDWDWIKEIKGWPSVSHKTWIYICQCFINFDEAFHPEVQAGGLWMNSGFTVDYEMGDWIVDISGCKLTYTEDSNVW